MGQTLTDHRKKSRLFPRTMGSQNSLKSLRKSQMIRTSLKKKKKNILAAQKKELEAK